MCTSEWNFLGYVLIALFVLTLIVAFACLSLWHKWQMEKKDGE